jgi:mRNA interferase MazF
VVSDWAPEAGDVIWLEFGPTLGTERSGRRPGLVLSEGSYNRATGRAVVAPISSKVRNWPLEVSMPEDSPIKGVVLIDQFRCLDWRVRHAKPSTRASTATVQDARAKLAALAGL